MLVLFFDTYITAGLGDIGGSYQSNHIADTLSAVRDKYPLYKWRRKIDIVKYTLCSYADIAWDKVVIRFECEDISETESFRAFCRDLYPEAQIETHRSATAQQYLIALIELGLDDDAWIFFSPNNDHPYVADPKEITDYMLFVESVAHQYPRNDVSLLFSHFTESMLDNRMTDPQWGYFGFKFKKILFEDARAIVTTSNIAPLDSIQVFQLRFLMQVFGSTKNKGRVIRLEDTEFCSSANHSLIQICPKIELCRHYDGYSHLMQYVPPLFIPPGFFESDIKVRYGYQQSKEGWVNLDPRASWMTPEVDLPILLEDIPYFWKKRISAIDINPDFSFEVDRSQLVFYKNFNNPWHARSKACNLIRSLYIRLILHNRSKAYMLIRRIAIAMGVFYPLKALKKKLANK